jgi:hypothetical protein
VREMLFSSTIAKKLFKELVASSGRPGSSSEVGLKASLASAALRFFQIMLR